MSLGIDTDISKITGVVEVTLMFIEWDGGTNQPDAIVFPDIDINDILRKAPFKTAVAAAKQRALKRAEKEYGAKILSVTHSEVSVLW